jgi:uncharacterized protein YkwD
MDRSKAAERLGAAAFAFGLACGSAPRPSAGTTRPGPAPKATQELDASVERYAWQPMTRSPRPVENPNVSDPCGASDVALRNVAERIARRETKGHPLLDTAEIAFALRSEGAPYVRPHAFTLVGVLVPGALQVRVENWRSSFPPVGDRRCAVATSRMPDGRPVHAFVGVTALADLYPLPTEVSIGTWLDVRALLVVPATRVEVIVLGPRGRPHAVLASLDGPRVRARFRTDYEGTWLVQLVATTETGPELAAEAIVQAGGAPPERFDASEAPGERSPAPGAAPQDAVLAMTNGARAAEGLARLERDPRLDTLALEQARTLCEVKSLSHDASGQSLVERLGPVPLRSAGENVAHATNLRRAHRALWRSPSHRENLLHPAFELIGIGVAQDDDGSVWLAEIFASTK